MKRQEVKNILFELGASLRLLGMPAVMERIYNYYINYSEEAFRKEIHIGPDGEIICKISDVLNQYDDGIIRIYRETENGEAIFENYEQEGMEQRGQYFIDRFGMDKMFKDYSNPLFEKECSIVRTEKRTIVLNNGAKILEDQGDPMLNYNNFTVLRKNASRTIGWDGNRDFLTTYYPLTREWFAVREGTIERKQAESIVLEENSEVKNLQNRIRTIGEKHKDEVDKLRKEKRQLQAMLERALKECESVKRSPSEKKLKQLLESPNIDEK